MLPILLKHPQAKLPTRAKDGDAGADLYLTEDVTLLQDEVKLVDLGFSTAIPHGFVGLVFSRSSMAKKHITLANSVGVIDAGYRGTVKAPLLYTPNIDMPVSIDLKEGDRISQLVIVPCLLDMFEEVSDLPTSSRGDAGFGSSGK
jgi:dUTP pyrophosphatase